MPADRRFLTARQAAEALGVSLPTLYAYTSRGQVQSETVPGRPRERRYYREDIERLRSRKEARRDPDQAAARGLHGGGPILCSAITLIHNGKLYYRGRDVASLARTATLEDIAEILWEANPGERDRLFAQPCPLPASQLARLRSLAADPLTLLQLALPVAGAADLAGYDLRPAAVRQTAARILRLLTSAIAGPSDAPVHLALQSKWAPQRPEVGDAIRTALVLCADHELNVSAFTARVTASAAASPYDVVSAALATLKGGRHGGEAERVEAILGSLESPRQARLEIAGRLRRGERVPGFGHPLYPAGDPRAALLLGLAEHAGNSSEWRLVRALRKAGADLLNEFPSSDFGLAAVARTYRLPSHAPLLLFALGRTVGWMAHAMEQYATGQLIRPRARYTGAMPTA